MKEQYLIYFWAHMLDEAFNKDALLTEGKHWPEDYVKTAYNLIKQSPIGQQSWYSDNFIKQDVETFANEFAPLSHKSSNLGFFMAIIRWFIEYSETSKEKYQEFIERKLDGIIASLLKIRADKSYDAMAEQIKKMSYADFMKLVEEVNQKTSNDGMIATSNATFKVIPIYSYEELNEKYKGRKTGYRGKSEWCHVNGKSTYDSWTKDGTQMFFVIEADNWQKIKAPDVPYKGQPLTWPDFNCYDDYGMSLIAILVDVQTNKLLNSTSRWNHVVLPKSGAADTMFESWQQLDKVVNLDVESFCKNECKELKEKLDKASEDANAEAARILKNAKTITDATLPKGIRKAVTKIVVPDSVERIGYGAFYNCKSLTSIKIPESVKSIGDRAFHKCTSLKSIEIPKHVKSIGEGEFFNCTSLTSIKIPESVKSIGDSAFYNCASLASIKIPKSVKSIGDWVFTYCKSLTSIEIPKSVKSIGEGAFYDCMSLTSIEIPKRVESIGDWVFENCDSLESIIFKGKTLEEVKAMDDYPWGIEDETIIKCER